MEQDKLQEIREGIGKIFAEFHHDNWAYLTDKEKAKFISWSSPVLKFLADKGLAITVDRDLPEIPANSFEAYTVDAVENKCLTTQIQMLEAGYVPVKYLRDLLKEDS